MIFLAHFIRKWEYSSNFFVLSISACLFVLVYSFVFASQEFSHRISLQIKTTSLENVFAAGFAVSFFIFIDSFLDFLFYPQPSRRQSFPFLLLSITILCADTTIFFAAIPKTDVYMAFVFTQMAEMMFLCISFAYRHLEASSKFSFTTSFVVAFLLVCLSIYEVVLPSVDSESRAYHHIVKKWINCVVLTLYVLPISTWIRHIFFGHEAFNWENFVCGLHVIGFPCIQAILCIVRWVFSSSDGSPGIEFFFAFAILFHIFLVVLTIVTKRVARKEAATDKRELEFKRMFVRYISHEMRTPLSTATMGLQLLHEELSRSRGMATFLDIVDDVRTSCDTAVETLNELLTLDKLEAGTLLLEKSKFNPFDFVKETVQPFMMQAKHIGVVLSLIIRDMPADNQELEPVLNADRNKISQVVRNIVSNALKFTPKGGTVTVVVKVTDLRKNNARLHICVTDTGVGLSSTNQARLFKEIVQFDPGKLQNGGGSGLGLYISYGITQQHHGTLSVFSNGEGSGSTFTLDLPLETVDVSANFRGIGRFGAFYRPGLGRVTSRKHISVLPTRVSVSRKSTATPPRTASTGGVALVSAAVACDDPDPDPDPDPDLSMDAVICNGDEVSEDESKVNLTDEDDGRYDILNAGTPLYILVVDDVPMNRKMQCRLLKRRSMRCDEACDGLEAVKMMAASLKDESMWAERYNLVVMDSEMPNMNGLEATRAMRSLGYRGVIMGLTGNVSKKDIYNFLGAGADVVLGKPLDINKFDNVVEELIATSRIFS